MRGRAESKLQKGNFQNCEAERSLSPNEEQLNEP